MTRGERGAQRVGRRAALATWGSHHRLAWADTIRRQRARPLATGLVALTLGVALVLPALLWAAVSGARALAGDWGTEVRINVFVESPTERSRESLLDAFEANAEIASVAWQGADASLAEFVEAMGFEDQDGAALTMLGEDPLPAVALVTPVRAVRSPARLRALATRLERLPGVVGVQIDLEWVERLAATLRALERLALGVGALLGLGVLLAVGGLTRATLDARRQEIVVLRLIGATDAFVRRPLLYAGALQGALGGLASWVLLAALSMLIGGPLADLAASYGLAGAPALPLAPLFPVLPLAGALLGWTGARLALGRRIAVPEP